MPENRSPYGLLVVGSAPGLRPIVNSSTSAPSVHRETQLSHPTPLKSIHTQCTGISSVCSFESLQNCGEVVVSQNQQTDRELKQGCKNGQLYKDVCVQHWAYILLNVFSFLTDLPKNPGLVTSSTWKKRSRSSLSSKTNLSAQSRQTSFKPFSRQIHHVFANFFLCPFC